MGKNNRALINLSSSDVALKSKRLILVDGNAIIHRAYHALPPLTTRKGELVNAVYGFASTLIKVISELRPDHILVAFDLKGPTFRHEEYNDYKANRTKAPEELYEQLDRVKEVTSAFNIPIFEKTGFEADDVIGTLAHQAEETGEIENIIVTGDLDTLQLISNKTKVYALRRGMSDAITYDTEMVRKRYGLEPHQMIDYKGLCGDPSDNIPGVKGIGETTAVKLLQKYGTIENVYQNISEIKGVLRERLEKDKAQAFLSKRLATIVKNVPLTLDLSQASMREFDRQKIINLFRELNFFSLVKRLPDSSQDSALNSKETIPKSESGVVDFKFELITENKLDDFIKTLSNLPAGEDIAIYLRTTRDKHYDNDLLGIALSYKTGRCGYIEFTKTAHQKIKSLLENENIRKIGYDLKYVYKILFRYGINLQGELYDVMLAAYVLNTGEKIEFKNLVLKELGEEITDRKEAGQLDLKMESIETIVQETCQRADYIWKLKRIYEEKIEKVSSEQLKKSVSSLKKSVFSFKTVFFNIEIPLIKILAGMEIAGIKLNTLLLKGISQKAAVTLKGLEKNIHKQAGVEFNINSPSQLANVLFNVLRLPSADIKKGKTGYSVAATELAKIKSRHKIIEKIEQYRELFKLKTTYLDTLPKMVDVNKRIHTTFNQAVTATGRLSSSDPNLQNIPVRTDLGQLLRTAFIAERGYKLISADYSQIDLRVMAHESSDKKLIESFYKGEDIHTATASEIFKVSKSAVTEKMRQAAKTLNFGILYGMSAFGFSQATGFEREEAQKFINEYLERFSGIAEYMKKTKKFAKEYGYVETELGRRRYIPEINSPNFQVQNAAERMAINMPIQGMAADIVKLAMIKIFEELGLSAFLDNRQERSGFKNDVRMLLQVHDEIILEVKEELTNEVAGKVKEIMENIYKLRVPLVANVKIGDNWGEI